MLPVASAMSMSCFARRSMLWSTDPVTKNVRGHVVERIVTPKKGMSDEDSEEKD